MSTPLVGYERVGNVAVIRLNRPESLNALSRALLADLDTAWRTFAEDGGARAAVYTGTGRAFCVGLDLKEAASGSDPTPQVTDERPLTIWHAGAITKPVIGAINGLAVGGGFIDVLRCDLRIAAEGAVFQLAEVARSVLPRPLFDGVAGPLADCILTELALGRKIGARRAYELGLVNSVVAADALLGEALALGEELAALPPLAVAATLEGLRRMREVRRPDEASLAWRREAAARLAASRDHHEAVRAFLEKRAPTYEGR